MRRDWTGPTWTKSRRGSVLRRGAECGGMGGAHGTDWGLPVTTPMFGGLLWARQDWREGGVSPIWAGQYRGGRERGNKQDSMSPPAALEVGSKWPAATVIKTQSRLWLTGGCRKRELCRKKRESDFFWLQACEVPIIPFMLRQEMADVVRKGLIKHCCRKQRGLNLDQIKPQRSPSPNRFTH